MMTDYAFSHKGQTGGGKELALAVGVPYPLPPTAAIPHIIYNPIGAVLPNQTQGLGEEMKSP